MRVLIVDDEPIARQVLRQELELVDGVEVIGEAGDGASALSAIAGSHPDVVFLDLEMPVMSGFEMIRHLKETPAPVIVIVTAYDQHAIEAFEAGAIDYLLKPVSQARLAQSLERARRFAQNPLQVLERIGQLQEMAPAKEGEARVRKVVGKLGDEYFLLDVQEVLAFQADGDLTWIVTAKHRYLASQNLSAIESRLKNSSFERIHRNALVNVNHIRKMSVLTSQRWLMTLSNGQELVVSKRRAQNVRPFIEW
ncbi:MAG: response regulator transcription factor [Acidobacteriaceae bacterium]|nr:response regulator transcription factor [Acidobacteriaceae bacterium]